MKALLLASIPLILLLSFGGGVFFWAAVSQIRFLSFFRNRKDQPPPLGISGWIAFYHRTLTGAYRLLWWSFRAAFQSGLRRPQQTTGRPVLCIHGLFMNSTCMWGIRLWLESTGRPTRGAFMGLPLPTPMTYRRPLQRVMTEMADRFPEQGFDIVAHSIGGVMIREVLRQEPRLADKIGRIVTLGSPHHGTAVVRWLKFGPIYKMLSQDSEYLKSLPDFRALAPKSGVTTVAAYHDLVVYPPQAAQLEGADHVTLSAVSHLGLMTQRRSLEAVEKALAAPPGQARVVGSTYT